MAHPALSLGSKTGPHPNPLVPVLGRRTPIKSHRLRTVTRLSRSPRIGQPGRNPHLARPRDWQASRRRPWRAIQSTALLRMRGTAPQSLLSAVGILPSGLERSTSSLAIEVWPLCAGTPLRTPHLCDDAIALDRNPSSLTEHHQASQHQRRQHRFNLLFLAPEPSHHHVINAPQRPSCSRSFVERLFNLPFSIHGDCSLLTSSEKEADPHRENPYQIG